MLWDDCQECKWLVAVVDHAVGVTLGAVVAGPRGEGFFAVVVEGFACAGKDVDDLAAGVVSMKAYGRAWLQGEASDLAVGVGVHAGGDIFFAALEGRDGLGLDFVEIYEHCEPPWILSCLLEIIAQTINVMVVRYNLIKSKT